MFTLQFTQLDAALGPRMFFSISKPATDSPVFSRRHSIIGGTFEFCERTQQLFIASQSKNFSGCDKDTMAAFIATLDQLPYAVFTQVCDNPLSASTMAALLEALQQRIDAVSITPAKPDEEAPIIAREIEVREQDKTGLGL